MQRHSAVFESIQKKSVLKKNVETSQFTIGIKQEVYQAEKREGQQQRESTCEAKPKSTKPPV